MAGLSCGSCGTRLSATAKFCSECGSPLTQATRSAEYKQVTVLFADVVHSMDIAVAVGPERLREIMAELVDHAAGVVKRYGGTVDKFTGDGIMAVFGAPIAYEDHGARACLAAMGIQEQMAQIATGVASRDGIDLRLRIGLNSGQVIAGNIGSTSLGYTTIGEHVGLAQRMESAAPPGGVMLSDSTARIVADVATLAEPEMVHFKAATEPVPAHRLLAMTAHQRTCRPPASTLVGREWELGALSWNVASVGRWPRMPGRPRRSRWYRQEPPGGRNGVDCEKSWRGGLFGLLRIPCRRSPVPCRRRPAADGVRDQRVERRIGPETHS